VSLDWLTLGIGARWWTVAVALAIICLPVSALSGQRACIVDVLRGEPVPQEMMLEDLATVRIVYIGEIHTIVRHHEVQKDILQGLSQGGLKLALGLEMFGVADQPVLDKWQRGNESFSHLRRDLGKKVWTNITDYRNLILTAREAKIPIVGLNADAGIVHKVARKGLEGLTQSERRALPAGVGRINPQHERLLRLRLRVHKAFKDKSLDRIILAQAVRDATMAAAVVRFLDSPGGADRLMVVVAGTGHLNYGFGIPDRVRRQKDWPYRIVLPTESGELVLSEKEKSQAVPITITHQDLKFITSPIADYLYVKELKREPHGIGNVAGKSRNEAQ
jgi:uncharacterized iron-regulated protein